MKLLKLSAVFFKEILCLPYFFVFLWFLYPLNLTGQGMDIRLEMKVSIIFFTWMIWNFAKDDDNLERLHQTLKNFRDDIGMKFQLDKCTKAIFERGRVVKSTSIKIESNTTIKELM